MQKLQESDSDSDLEIDAKAHKRPSNSKWKGSTVMVDNKNIKETKIILFYFV